MELSELTTRRERLQESLADLVEDTFGKVNIYYNPPENIRMTYPCFVINLDDINDIYASNEIWNSIVRYSVTFITRKVQEDIIPLMLSGFHDYVSFNRSFASDGLSHYVFTISVW